MPEIGSKAELSALIGDVVRSREVGDRAGLQQRLRATLAELNLELRGALAADLVLTAGDEVQGLLRDAAAGEPVVRRLSEAVAPEARIVFGLGRGVLSTGPLDPDPSRNAVAELDGPCFHRARGALEQARKGGSWVEVAGFGAVDGVLGALFELLGVLRAGWTDKQTRYTAAARDRLQKQVADDFGVSPSVISESLAAAHFTSVRRGEAAVTELLRSFASEAAS